MFCDPDNGTERIWLGKEIGDKLKACTEPTAAAAAELGLPKILDLTRYRALTGRLGLEMTYAFGPQ
jgi:hypothetical protein